MTRLSRLCPPAAIVLLMAAVRSAAVPVAAQDVFEIVDVPLVEVDVLVTDRQGRPVSDLSRKDFTLLVDGREEEITFFASPTQAPAGGIVEEGTVPIHLALLFDNSSVERQNRNIVIEDLREFLRGEATVQQEIMVATVELQGLAVQQQFTRDLDSVDRALELVTETVASDVYLFEYETLLRDIQKLAGARDPTLRDSTSQTATLVSRIIAFSERSRQTGQQIARHIWQLTDAMEGLPGRKSILYIGGAVSVSPGEALLTALKGVLDRSGDGRARQASANVPAGVGSGDTRELEALSQAASLHGVAIHSFLVGGGAQVLSTGSSASSITAKDSSTMDSSGSWSPGFDSRTRSESRSALEMLAAATGGRVHAVAVRSPEVAGRIHDQMTSRYLLGFHPAAGADGRDHQLQVRVEPAALRVHHRTWFQARGWDEATAANLRSSLRFGGGEDLHGIELEVLPPRRNQTGALQVPLMVRFPLASLAMEPVGATHRAQISLFATSDDGEGAGGSPVLKHILPVVLHNEELQGAMGQMAEHRLELDIGDEAEDLGIALRDDLSTEMSIVTVSVSSGHPVRILPVTERPSESSPAEAVDPPIRLASAALLLSGQQGGGLRLEVAEPSSSKASGPHPVRLDVLMPADSASAGWRDLELHAYVLDSRGEPLSRSSRRFRVELARGQEDLEIPIDELVADRTLVVLVRDLRTDEFGLLRIPATRLLAASGTRDSSLSIFAVHVGLSETPLAGRESDNEGVEMEATAGNRRISKTSLASDLLAVLELAAAGSMTDARFRLRDREVEATSGRSPMAIVDLGRKEAKAVLQLADDSWERLLPLALCWSELIEDYRRLRLGPLSEHAIMMSTQLATRMARQAETPESRIEAANLLVSLAGHVLYSQRLGKTEELLDLAVRVDPDNDHAALALAATREQQGNFRAAIDGLERFLETRPGSEEGRLRLAVNQLRIGDGTGAEELLRSLWGEGEVDWITKVAAQELVRWLAVSKRWQEAVGVGREAIRRWPDEPGMQVQVAWLADRQGESETSAAIVSRLATAGTWTEDSPRFRYHRWYQEGLEEVREELSKRSRDRAAEVVGAMAAKSPAGGGA